MYIEDGAVPNSGSSGYTRANCTWGDDVMQAVMLALYYGWWSETALDIVKIQVPFGIPVIPAGEPEATIKAHVPCSAGGQSTASFWFDHRPFKWYDPKQELPPLDCWGIPMGTTRGDSVGNLLAELNAKTRYTWKRYSDDPDAVVPPDYDKRYFFLVGKAKTPGPEELFLSQYWGVDVQVLNWGMRHYASPPDALRNCMALDMWFDQYKVPHFRFGDGRGGQLHFTFRVQPRNPAAGAPRLPYDPEFRPWATDWNVKPIPVSFICCSDWFAAYPVESAYAYAEYAGGTQSSLLLGRPTLEEHARPGSVESVILARMNHPRGPEFWSGGGGSNEPADRKRAWDIYQQKWVYVTYITATATGESEMIHLDMCHSPGAWQGINQACWQQTNWTGPFGWSTPAFNIPRFGQIDGQANMPQKIRSLRGNTMMWPVMVSLSWHNWDEAACVGKLGNALCLLERPPLKSKIKFWGENWKLLYTNGMDNGDGTYSYACGPFESTNAAIYVRIPAPDPIIVDTHTFI